MSLSSRPASSLLSAARRPLSRCRWTAASLGARSRPPRRGLGASGDSNAGGAVSTQDAELAAMASEMRFILAKLRDDRDMTLNEIKLTLGIEDPRVAMRRQQLGIEDESGVSRDEVAAALMEVAQGAVPRDRMTMDALLKELRSFDVEKLAPQDEMEVMPGGKIRDTSKQGGSYAELMGGAPAAASESEAGAVKERQLSDVLPNWVGYSFLYGVSIVPILLGVMLVVILFLNSLR